MKNSQKDNLTPRERIAVGIVALGYYLFSMLAFFVGIWAGWSGNYARGAFFLALAICFDRYGDYNADKVGM